MKLLRCGNKGAERPGLPDEDGRIRDLPDPLDEVEPHDLSRASLDRLRALDPASHRAAPAGLAQGMRPEPRWLRSGDATELGIERLCRQRQRAVERRPGEAT